MDTRKKANIRVKQNITNSLFTLMKQKSLADILLLSQLLLQGGCSGHFDPGYAG